MDIKTKFLLKEVKGKWVKRAYGINFSAKIPDWRIELHCALRYKLTKAMGGLGPANHFWNFIKICYPEYYNPENYFANLFMEELVEGKHKYVFQIGPGGFGKTTLAALWGIGNYVEDPRGTIVVCCTSTADAAETRIWGKVKKLFNQVDDFKKFTNITDNKIYYRYKSPTKKEVDKFHCMVMRTLPRGKGGADRVLRGTHADRKLIILYDEMDQSAPIDDVIENLELGGVKFKLVGLGNPSDRHSALGLACEPPAEDGGYDSINPLEFTDIKQCRWQSVVKDGIVLFFPGYLNPRIVLSEKYPDRKEYYDRVFNFFTTRKEIEEKKGSSKWMEQFIGFFPSEASQGYVHVLEKSDLDRTKATQLGVFDGSDHPIKCASCDLGFTNDGDPTIIRVAKYGTLINGKKGFCMLGPSKIKRIIIPKVLKINKYEWLSKEVLKYLIEEGIRPENFCIDSNVQGDAVVEYLKQYNYKGFRCITSKGKASNTPLARDNKLIARDECVNKITEMWLFTKHLILNGQVFGLDTQTINEFTSRCLYIVKNKSKLEEKLEYVARMTTIGRRGHSPDYADTLVYMADLCRSFGLLADFTPLTHDYDSFVNTYFKSGRHISQEEIDKSNREWEEKQFLNDIQNVSGELELNLSDFADGDDYL